MSIEEAVNTIGDPFERYVIPFCDFCLFYSRNKVIDYILIESAYSNETKWSINTDFIGSHRGFFLAPQQHEDSVYTEKLFDYVYP